MNEQYLLCKATEQTLFFTRSNRQRLYDTYFYIYSLKKYFLMCYIVMLDDFEYIFGIEKMFCIRLIICVT